MCRRAAPPPRQTHLPCVRASRPPTSTHGWWPALQGPRPQAPADARQRSRGERDGARIVLASGGQGRAEVAARSWGVRGYHGTERFVNSGHGCLARGRSRLILPSTATCAVANAASTCQRGLRSCAPPRASHSPERCRRMATATCSGCAMRRAAHSVSCPLRAARARYSHSSVPRSE
eukprot:scaffold1533_cov388-Prasinococcus_capsulatus_cf.AAC.6